MIPCLSITGFKVDSWLSLPKVPSFCLILLTHLWMLVFYQFDYNITCFLKHLHINWPFYCWKMFQPNLFNWICFRCRIIATVSLNFGQLKNFFSSFDNRSPSVVAKFINKVAFTSAHCHPDCAGHSLSGFHKNLGSPNYVFVFFEFTSFNPLGLSSVGFSLVGTLNHCFAYACSLMNWILFSTDTLNFLLLLFMYFRTTLEFVEELIMPLQSVPVFVWKYISGDLFLIFKSVKYKAFLTWSSSSLR